jgi:hypothetical protein
VSTQSNFVSIYFLALCPHYLALCPHSFELYPTLSDPTSSLSGTCPQLLTPCQIYLALCSHFLTLCPHYYTWPCAHIAWPCTTLIEILCPTLTDPMSTLSDSVPKPSDPGLVPALADPMSHFLPQGEVFQQTCESKDDDIARLCYENCTRVLNFVFICQDNLSLHRFLALIFFVKALRQLRQLKQ